MEKQKNQNSQTTLYNKRTSRGITIPDFKGYYRAVILKTAWYWQKNIQLDQCKQIKVLILTNTPMNTRFMTEQLRVYNGNRKAFSTNGAATTE